MKKISFRLTPTEDSGLFHNSRADSRTTMKVCNLLIEKINELIEKNNELEEEVRKVKFENKLI